MNGALLALGALGVGALALSSSGSGAAKPPAPPTGDEQGLPAEAIAFDPRLNLAWWALLPADPAREAVFLSNEGDATLMWLGDVSFQLGGSPGEPVSLYLWLPAVDGFTGTWILRRTLPRGTRTDGT